MWAASPRSPSPAVSLLIYKMGPITPSLLPFHLRGFPRGEANEETNRSLHKDSKVLRKHKEIIYVTAAIAHTHPLAERHVWGSVRPSPERPLSGGKDNPSWSLGTTLWRCSAHFCSECHLSWGGNQLGLEEGWGRGKTSSKLYYLQKSILSSQHACSIDCLPFQSAPSHYTVFQRGKKKTTLLM